MLSAYVTATGNTTIFERALPLAEVGLRIDVPPQSWHNDIIYRGSSGGGLIIAASMSQALIRIKPIPCTITLSTIPHLVQSLISQVCSCFIIDLYYSQLSSDYLTANVPATLNDTQRADLYAELASGAETGGSFLFK